MFLGNQLIILVNNNLIKVNLLFFTDSINFVRSSVPIEFILPQYSSLFNLLSILCYRMFFLNSNVVFTYYLYRNWYILMLEHGAPTSKSGLHVLFSLFSYLPFYDRCTWRYGEDFTTSSVIIKKRSAKGEIISPVLYTPAIWLLTGGRSSVQ